MPEFSVTEAQLQRLDNVCDDLEAAYVDEYGTVRPQDALEYLLDTYTPPEDGERPSGSEGAAAEADESDGEADADTPDDPADDSPESTLQQAMNLLEAHDDRCREGSGDEPYEVDLPDGSTEPARTKDDVKRLLFNHWK
jgi:hypothetical protein